MSRERVFLDRQQDKAARDAALIEDVEWLLACGEHPERIPARVGRTLCAIEQALRRAGRRDLASIFGAQYSQQRRDAAA